MATCTKIRYADRRAATVAANKLSKRRGRRRPAASIYAYRCEHCSDWHLTSMSASLHREKRRERRKAIKALGKRVGREIDFKD